MVEVFAGILVSGFFFFPDFGMPVDKECFWTLLR